MRTSLYAKAFIDGFSKPSYVVVTAELDGVLGEERFVRAARGLVDEQPLLRSKLVRNRLGLPARFVHHPTDAWFDGGGCVTSIVDERRLLATGIDLERCFPFRLWLTQRDGRSVVIARAHHAIVDAHAGRHLMQRFASLCRSDRSERAPAEIQPWRERAKRAWAWLKATDWSTRVPAASVVCDFRPRAALADLPVGVWERRVARAEHERLRRLAAREGATFSQLLFVALLSAMHQYNHSRTCRPPDPIGLMVATSRRHRRVDRTQPTGFRADTRLISVTSAELGGRAALLASIQRQLAVRSHNDLALAALVGKRQFERWLGLAPPARRIPEPVTALHFVASDLTVGATRFDRRIELGQGLRVASLRYLVSPVAADMAGLVTHLYGDELCFTLLGHEGALDAEELLDHLFDALGLRVAMCGAVHA